MTSAKKKSDTKEEGEEQSELIETEGQPIIDFPYNKRTAESYEKNGWEVPSSVDGQEKTFLSLVNTEEDKGNGPIQREITRLVRLKARDYDSPIKGATKEYLIFYENWTGVDWLGVQIAPVTDHIEGMYMEQETKTVVERDMRTGRISKSQKRAGEHPVHYIPFSKEKVDEILEGVDKNSMIFRIKFPAAAGSGSYGIRSNFTYDHFVNLSMEDAFKVNSKSGGSSMNVLTAANAIRSESGIS